MRVFLSDLDGVLVDSTAALERTWVRWGRRFGADGRAIVAANHGRPARDVLGQFVSGAELDAACAAFEDDEVTDTDGIVALPGAAEVLRLPVVAIVTSCTRRLALARLSAAGLPEPAVLVSADMVARGKPAPDPYLLGAELLRRRPGGLCRAGGRSRRHRRRPGGRNDRVGGRHHPCAGAAQRGPPRGGGAARASGNGGLTPAAGRCRSSSSEMR